MDKLDQLLLKQQKAKNELKLRIAELNKIDDMLEDFNENNKFYLCNSYTSSAIQEARYILQNTNTVIKPSFHEDLPYDEEYVGYFPIINANIPSDLIKNLLQEYGNILIKEIDNLQKQLRED